MFVLHQRTKFHLTLLCGNVKSLRVELAGERFGIRMLDDVASQTLFNDIRTAMTFGSLNGLPLLSGLHRSIFLLSESNAEA